MLGLLLVAGGKYTTYRVMAADVVDRAARRLGAAAPPVAHRRPAAARRGRLPGHVDGTGPTWPAGTGCRSAWWSTCWSGTARSPCDLLALVDADPLLAAPLAGAPEYLAAEVAYAARAEGALHLEDVLTRRTRISFETAHRGAGVGRARGRVDGRGARLGRGRPGPARSSTTWPGWRRSGSRSGCRTTRRPTRPGSAHPTSGAYAADRGDDDRRSCAGGRAAS